MNKKRMRFLRIVAGVIAAVIMVCSMQTMVGIAAEEITDSGTVEETQEETVSAESDSVSDVQEPPSGETVSAEAASTAEAQTEAVLAEVWALLM